MSIRRFLTSIRAIRSTFAVMLVALLVLASALKMASAMPSCHEQPPAMTHMHHEPTAALELAAVSDVDLDTDDRSGNQHHDGHGDGHNCLNCTCACHPAARLPDSAASLLVHTGQRFVVLSEAAPLKSITMDVDDPPIIIALS